MSEIATWVLAGMFGAILGLVHFGGLWLTLKRLDKSRHPAFLMAVSFVARTALVIAGFYVVIGGRWERAVAGLVGFILIRSVLVSRIRPRTRESETT